MLRNNSFCSNGVSWDVSYRKENARGIYSEPLCLQSAVVEMPVQPVIASFVSKRLYEYVIKLRLVAPLQGLDGYRVLQLVIALYRGMEEVVVLVFWQDFEAHLHSC